MALGARSSEGRDYTELFDALYFIQQIVPMMAGNLDKNGQVNGAYYTPDGSNTAIAGKAHDGITTVEQFVTFEARLGSGLYVSKECKALTEISIAHDTEHFISNADIGRDLPDSNGIPNGFVDHARIQSDLRTLRRR